GDRRDRAFTQRNGDGRAVGIGDLSLRALAAATAADTLAAGRRLLDRYREKISIPDQVAGDARLTDADRANLAQHRTLDAERRGRRRRLRRVAAAAKKARHDLPEREE